MKLSIPFVISNLSMQYYWDRAAPATNARQHLRARHYRHLTEIGTKNAYWLSEADANQRTIKMTEGRKKNFNRHRNFWLRAATAKRRRFFFFFDLFNTAAANERYDSLNVVVDLTEHVPPRSLKINLTFFVLLGLLQPLHNVRSFRAARRWRANDVSLQITVINMNYVFSVEIASPVQADVVAARYDV